MMPRSDGIVLGGTAERNVSTMEPNEAARKAVVDGHIELYNGMRRPPSGTRLARSEAPREVPPVESFFGLKT